MLTNPYSDLIQSKKLICSSLIEGGKGGKFRDLEVFNYSVLFSFQALEVLNSLWFGKNKSNHTYSI